MNDPAYVERAEILREKGTNRSRFYRGQVDKYTWVDIGSSYLMSDLNAAYLYAQFEHMAEVQARREHIWHYYQDHLAEWAQCHHIQLPTVPAYCDQSYHMFYLIMPSLAERQALIEHLRARDIVAVFHYLPLHISEMGQRFGGKPGDCPVTEDLSDRLVRLPFYFSLTDDLLDRVVQALLTFE